MGEVERSTEFEAYSIQNLTATLLYQYEAQRTSTNGNAQVARKLGRGNRVS